MKRTVMLSALAALAVVVALSVLLATQHPVGGATSFPSPLLGTRAPNFASPQLSGGTFELRAHRGDIVVLNFWASWCGPCVTEAPELSSFAWRERHHRVVVEGVVFNDTVAAARGFARHYGSLYSSVIDHAGAIANQYGVTSPPTTFVIDRRGRVVVELIGALSAAQLVAVVDGVHP